MMKKRNTTLNSIVNMDSYFFLLILILSSFSLSAALFTNSYAGSSMAIFLIAINYISWCRTLTYIVLFWLSLTLISFTKRLFRYSLQHSLLFWSYILSYKLLILLQSFIKEILDLFFCMYLCMIVVEGKPRWT